MRRTQRQYIVDILNMMSYAEQFVEGMTLETLQNDSRTFLALQSCFSIIGEAANQVDSSIKAQHPDVPWREMISMRNFIVHGYWNVSSKIVLNTVNKDFPIVRPLMERILDTLPTGETPQDGDHT